MKGKDNMGMKIRTIRYIFKEGFLNICRNKLMSLASLTIVTAALLIFGIFYIMVYNVNENVNNIKEQPHLVVFCEEKIADFEIARVSDYLTNSDDVLNFEYISRDMALERYKESLGEDSKVLEGLDSSFLSPLFIIELNNPELTERVADEIKELYGVDKVAYSKKSIDLIMLIISWVKAASIVLVIVLFIVSILIVSNTIKLTVYARRREIGIMKHIGATDGFIRWPFVVEGVIIGVISAAFALIVTNYFYRGIESMVNTELMNFGGNEIIKLVSANDMGFALVIFYSLLGMIVGGIGSIISIKRYLKV